MIYKNIQKYLFLLLINLGSINTLDAIDSDYSHLLLFIDSMKLIGIGALGILAYAAADKYYYFNIASTQTRLDRVKEILKNPAFKDCELHYLKEKEELEQKLKNEQEALIKAQSIQNHSNIETSKKLESVIYPKNIEKSEKKEEQSFFFSKQDPNLSYKNRFFSKALIRYQNKIERLLAAPKSRIFEQSAVYNREQIRKFHIDYDPNIDSPFM